MGEFLPASTPPLPAVPESPRLSRGLAAALLGLALVLGGGGSPSPLPELVLQLLAVLVLLAWLTLPRCRDGWRLVPRPALLIAGILVALPLLQLIPLPPAVWQAMPGRDLQREALALVDLDQTWRPISLAPQRTLASLLSLLPPLLVLAMAAALDRRGRIGLVWVVLTAGVASLLIGASQLTGGEASFSHFYGDVRAVLTGFQANRNSTADFLLITMLAVPVLVSLLVERGHLPASRTLVLGLAGGGMALFALAVVLTASRTGIALLPIPLMAALWLLRGWLPQGRKVVLAAVGVLPVIILLTFLAVRSNPTLAAVAERFVFVRELRPELWRDALLVVREHFPAGVGMGNFVPALLTQERLEVVRPFMPNRAHNDYLELLAEAGIAGIAALCAAGWLILREGWRALRDPARSSGGLAVFAIGGLTILALHSVVDYPLRSMSMACLGAFCAALLMAPRGATGSGEVE